MSDNGPFVPTAKFELEKDSVPIREGTAVNRGSEPVLAARPLPLPERIGRYRIERILGTGGFGLVYLAHDEQLERRVAVKVPHAKLIASPADVTRYLAEARLVAGLTHPHIVPVYDVGSTDQFPCYIVSQYIDGSTLGQKISQARPTPAAAAELLATIAEALHYAHKQRIVHRDVKPGNILIDSTGQPFVVDFGLALREQETPDAHRYAGTPAYMSPEQARGEGHRVDGRSDIFSLGVILYEMLVGRPPFQDDTLQGLLEQVTTVDPKPLRQIDDQIPKELERICLKALSKRATDRYTTAKDLADDLRHWISNLDGGNIAAQTGRELVKPIDEPELVPAPGLSKHAFISYATPDKEAAYRLCRLLEEQGIGCWIAPRDVAPGADYGEALIRAIEATAATVLLLSAHSNASIHVAHEIERATSKRKRVIPVRLADIQPGPSLELHLASAHWLDAWRVSPEQVAAQLALVLRPQGSASRSSPSTLPASDSGPIRIVPKGLRSFDAHDADFFLELLPGPRDREGLPNSIRFWKTRIEETDADSTFSVGLIYGPSGCGKSSLVKAGLLPRLADTVITVYVEATAEETETRLLNGLRKRYPALPENLSLKDTLVALRRGQGVSAGKKVLIVLDQFEQWLHAKKEEPNTELVQALRQCDGEHVQCIVMVRDDFWMAVTRFLAEMEVELVQGRNLTAADLFDPRHAKRVLSAFGRAFDNLPEKAGEITAEQKDFVSEAVSGLAQNGKVICVRLALFAEMMKSKPWTPAALKEVGGTEGVGITFLEETFSAQTANPKHRLHQKAARAVLEALLPETGSDIKGHMRLYAELLEASGYGSRPKDFDDLIRILDGEIRLITPTDPEGNEGVDGSTSPVNTTGQKYYQLTHDYLVPSLRDWLTRKQKETRRGRAELRLAERAALWQAKPENRHLPSWWEYLTAVWLVPAKNRTAPQQKMLRKAGRVHALRWGSALAILLLIGFGIWNVVATERQRSLLRQVVTAVDAVQNNRGLAVPFTVRDLERLPRDMVAVELKARYANAEPQHKLGLAYALAEYGEVDAPFLGSQIAHSAPEEVDNFVVAVRHARDASLDTLQAFAKETESKQDWRLKARLAVVALHLEDDRIAADMCRIDERPDPIQRTIFIDEFPAWHGDLANLAKSCGAITDPALRSAFCLGIGGISPERLVADETDAWKPVLADWFQTAPDNATHSASGWALRQWGIEAPALSATSQPNKGRQWFVNSLGMTLLKIEHGVFVRKDDTPEAKDQTVQLTRAFFLCDREISVGQFQQFISDANYPNEEKPAEWPGASESVSPTPDHPVQEVNWYDAELFCNWLSRKEGRTPCYGLIKMKGRNPEKPEEEVEVDDWGLVANGKGYRLPTEAEWEFACRAGTTSDFASGSDEEILRKYAWFQSNRAVPGGSKLPNGWGLFDMHGNVCEWCQDSYRGVYRGDEASDPAGPSAGWYRVYRGGSWYHDAAYCRSGDRFRNQPGSRNNEYGFRPALSSVHSSQASERSRERRAR